MICVDNLILSHMLFIIASVGKFMSLSFCYVSKEKGGRCLQDKNIDNQWISGEMSTVSSPVSSMLLVFCLVIRSIMAVIASAKNPTNFAIVVAFAVFF